MEKHIMEQIQTQLCDILRDKAQRGIGSPSDVETVKNALSGINKIKIIEAMERYGDEKSFASYPVDYRRGGRMPYYDDGDYSYRRTRDDYDVNHSGHTMREQLERMMQTATTDRERMAIREALSKM